MRLPATLDAWGTDAFAATLKRELAECAHQLPLQQALSGASAVADEPIAVLLLNAEADAEELRVKVGIFFAGVLAGCSCADDPTPVEAQQEYGEWLLTIRRTNAAAVAALL